GRRAFGKALATAILPPKNVSIPLGVRTIQRGQKPTSACMAGANPMASIRGNLVIGVFDHLDQARVALAPLHELGFEEHELGLVARHEEQVGLEAGGEHKQHQPSVREAAELGALAGAGIGGLGALAIVSGAIPVIGPVLTAGFLASIAAGVAGGAVTGTL